MDGTGRTRRKSSDIRVLEVSLYLHPVSLRVPLRFGTETVTEVTFARVAVLVENRRGRRGMGWGESPLNVSWAWPSSVAYDRRARILEHFSVAIGRAWCAGGARDGGGEESDYWGHPLELGNRFITRGLPDAFRQFNAGQASAENVPWLAALICAAPFDIAVHDAFGIVNEVPTYATYGADYMNFDLSEFFGKGDRPASDFVGNYPDRYLAARPARRLDVWHLVGAKDPIHSHDLGGEIPDDGYPVTLPDWIRHDRVRYVKIKLCGMDWDWDYRRCVEAGAVALSGGVRGLSTDFNCTVREGGYVTELLDRLVREYPNVYERLLYVEQPFPVDTGAHDAAAVRAVASRKPIVMDESAYDWRVAERARSFGWSGVALKTCKTQSGALLSLAWARAHEMGLVVQDLSNAMLAQIPHVLLGAYADTGLGIESNGIQYYPDVSMPEAQVHPGLYRRVNGRVDLRSLRGPGFGYRMGALDRRLPAPAFTSTR